MNTEQVKGDRSLFLKKVATVLGFYYVAVIITPFILGVVISLALLDMGNSPRNIGMMISPIASFQLYILVVLVGLVGLFYGLKYIVRKFKFGADDVKGIIFSFAVIQCTLFEISHQYNYSQISSAALINFIVVLLINCFAIWFFSKKLLK